MVNESTETVSPTESRTGRVKWFNNRAGYGFVTDSSEGNTDYFVHHSAIRVGKEQYKYLVQGEYVNFSLVKSESESYEFQVGEVSGVNGGQLMCETREEIRSQRRERSATTAATEGGESGEGEQTQQQQQQTPRQPRRRARRGGSGPRDGAREGEEWMLVRRYRPQQRGGRGGRGGGRQQQRAPRDESSQQS